MWRGEGGAGESQRDKAGETTHSASTPPQHTVPPHRTRLRTIPDTDCPIPNPTACRARPPRAAAIPVCRAQGRAGGRAGGRRGGGRPCGAGGPAAPAHAAVHAAGGAAAAVQPAHRAGAGHAGAPPPGSPSWAGSLSLHPCHEVRLRGLFLRFIKLPVLKNPTSHPISGGQFLNLEGGRVFFTETPVRGRNLGHFGSDPPPNPSNHPTPSACLLLPPLQPSKPYPTALQGWLGESRVKTRKQVQNHRKHGKHGK